MNFCADDSFDDSEYGYEEVGIDEEFESEGDIESEDLEATLLSLQKLSFLLGEYLAQKFVMDSWTFIGCFSSAVMLSFA